MASIFFSFWIVTGQLLTQTDPPYLPLSRDGCPVPVTNVTLLLSNITEDTLLSTTQSSLSLLTTTQTNLLSTSTEEIILLNATSDGNVTG